MATTSKKPSGKTSARRTTPKAPDAIAMLREEHKKVTALFDEYEKSRSATKKQNIVSNICLELSVHATLEEEIFYPAVRAALKDRELVPEAIVEHATVKEFIAKVDGKLADGDMFDAQIQVMGEYVKHHVKEEQNEMFPKARSSKLDMAALGQQMLERKQQLLADPQQIPKKPAAVSELPSAVPA